MVGEAKFWSATRDPPGLDAWLDGEVGLAIAEYVAEGALTISHEEGHPPQVTFSALPNDGEDDVSFSIELRELLISEIDSLSSEEYGTTGEERPLLIAIRDDLAEAMALIDRRLAMFTEGTADA